jgi:outer membrane protein assembly factor BamB
VAPDRVFVTETRDKSDEVVRALDRDTGKELWRAQWKGAITVPAVARAGGEWIRSTPAYDGRALFVGGMRDVLVCLEAEDGKERWRVDFPERYKTETPALGLVCSPLIDGDAVFLQAAAAMVRLDKETGKSAWRALDDKGDSYGSAVSSPVLATLAGKRQLVVQNRKVLAGLDPADGAVLWRQDVPAFRYQNIITPTLCGGDGLVTSAFGGRSFRFDVVAKKDGFEVRTAWEDKAQGYMSSPVVVAGHVYMHLRNQHLVCLDAGDGKECWTTEKAFGAYWSMIARKDRILALDQRGVLYLIKANPEKFEPLDERTVGDAETWAHLAVCGDELYVRELNALAAFRWRTPPEK